MRPQALGGLKYRHTARELARAYMRARAAPRMSLLNVGLFCSATGFAAGYGVLRWAQAHDRRVAPRAVAPRQQAVAVAHATMETDAPSVVEAATQIEAMVHDTPPTADSGAQTEPAAVRGTEAAAQTTIEPRADAAAQTVPPPTTAARDTQTAPMAMAHTADSAAQTAPTAVMTTEAAAQTATEPGTRTGETQTAPAPPGVEAATQIEDPYTEPWRNVQRPTVTLLRRLPAHLRVSSNKRPRPPEAYDEPQPAVVALPDAVPEPQPAAVDTEAQTDSPHEPAHDVSTASPPLRLVFVSMYTMTGPKAELLYFGLPAKWPANFIRMPMSHMEAGNTNVQWQGHDDSKDIVHVIIGYAKSVPTDLEITRDIRTIKRKTALVYVIHKGDIDPNRLVILKEIGNIRVGIFSFSIGTDSPNPNRSSALFRIEYDTNRYAEQTSAALIDFIQGGD